MMTVIGQAYTILAETSLKRYAGALLVMVTSFALMGTVAALWQNPVFIRMTPVGDWELILLALVAVFSGAFVIVRRPFCDTPGSENTATAGGVVGFIGLACPVCNKILLLVFGSELLLTYFDPVRIYLAALGVIIMAWVVLREWRLRFRPDARDEKAVVLS